MVVVVPDDELLDDSSFLEQEMMVVAEKHEISKFYKIFFIFSSIPKKILLDRVLGEPSIYQNLGGFTRMLGGCGGCLVVKN